MNKPSLITLVFAAVITLSITGCTKVGSEAWCAKLKDTPEGEWTVNEITDFAKHCVFK